MYWGKHCEVCGRPIIVISVVKGNLWYCSLECYEIALGETKEEGNNG